MKETAAITIYRGGAADLDHIISQRRGMFLDMGLKDDAALQLAMVNSRKFFERLIAEGRYHCWFAKTGSGEVVAGGGLVIYDWTPHPDTPTQEYRALAKNVYVAPAFRRQGIARLLMEEMIAFCRERGYTQLWLHASDVGRPLYESMGFKATNEMKLVISSE